jgi:hypothetical protein
LIRSALSQALRFGTLATARAQAIKLFHLLACRRLVTDHKKFTSVKRDSRQRQFDVGGF